MKDFDSSFFHILWSLYQSFKFHIASADRLVGFPMKGIFDLSNKCKRYNIKILQARSCLYACTRVRTHHFPLGLCPTPNWGLNYGPLPYFAYTSFPGWLRPSWVKIFKKVNTFIFNWDF